MMNVTQIHGGALRWGLLGALTALWFLSGVGCQDDAPTPAIYTDSETHWIGACEQDTDCDGQLSCICGVCTAQCEGEDACGESLICASNLTADTCDQAPQMGGICWPLCEDDEACSDLGPRAFCDDDGQCARRPEAVDEAPPTPEQLEACLTENDCGEGQQCWCGICSSMCQEEEGVCGEGMTCAFSIFESECGPLPNAHGVCWPLCERDEECALLGPDAFCGDNGQCAGADVRPAQCEGTGGRWDDSQTACGDYVCGVLAAPLCPEPTPGCDCGPTANFEWGQGCVEDPEVCDPIEEPETEEQLCAGTGGRWRTDGCAPYVCGEEADIDCDEPIPGCDCGPFGVFDPMQGCIVGGGLMCGSTEDECFSTQDCGTGEFCTETCRDDCLPEDPDCCQPRLCADADRYSCELAGMQTSSGGVCPEGTESIANAERLQSDVEGEFCCVPQNPDCTDMNLGADWFCNAHQSCRWVYDSSSALLNDGSCLPRVDLDEEALCGASGGQWEEDACGHFACGQFPALCGAPEPGCNCGPEMNFDPVRGCTPSLTCQGFDHLVLDPESLTFYDLPINSYRTAVSGYAPLARTCVVMVWSHGDGEPPEGSSLRCDLSAPHPYTIIEPNREPEDCEQLWDYGPNVEARSIVDGCVDFESLGGRNFIDLTTPVRGPVFAGSITASNLSTFERPPVVVGVAVESDGSDNLYIQKQANCDPMAWFSLTLDGQPYPTGNQPGPCDGICEDPSSEVHLVADFDNPQGSYYTYWDGDVYYPGPECTAMPLPPGDWRAQGCFGFEAMTNGEQTTVSEPFCREISVDVSTKRIIFGLVLSR